MRAELFDINRDRRGQSLRAQHVESCRRAVAVREKGQPLLRSCLVGRNPANVGLKRGKREAPRTRLFMGCAGGRVALAIPAGFIAELVRRLWQEAEALLPSVH